MKAAVNKFLNFEVNRSKFSFLINAPVHRWLVLLTALVFSLWPIQTEQHSLMPRFAKQELGLSEIKPWMRGINRLSPGHFKVFIGLDYAENMSLKNIAEHQKVVQQIDEEQLSQRARAYPWRYAKSIAFPIATFQRENKCELRLVLDNGAGSDLVDCRDIVDNHLVSFHFGEWIKPGIYSVILESTGEPGQEIAPYYATALNQDAWIIPSQGKTSVCFWEYIQALVYRNKWVAFAYFLLMICLVCSLASSVSSLWKLVTIYSSAIIFTNLATLPFSGHDETAHVSMYHEALKEHSVTKIADPEFNLKTWQAMTESDFFRLHDVEPRYSEECPHQIVGSCGITKNPTDLYSLYAHALDLSGLSTIEPAEIVLTARLFNVGMICVLVVLGVLLLQRDEFQSFLTALIFLGGLIAQSASLTNDVPMFLLGCAALLCYPIVVWRRGFFGLISVLILIMFYWFLRRVDVSSVTVLPLLISLALLLIIKALTGSQVSSPISRSNMISKNPVIDFVGIIGLIVLFIGSYRFILNGAYVLEPLKTIEPRVGIAYDFWRLPLKDFPRILVAYWKSYVGSFVWGHSYWPNWYYILAFLAYSAAAYEGLSNLKAQLSRVYYFGCIILIAGIVSMQLISVLSIAAAPSFLLNDPIARDSFAKVRLTAPLAAGLLVLPLMSTKVISERSSIAGFLMRCWLLIFAMASCFWLPTRFFFADIF